MKYRVKLNDSIDLIVDANSEVEAVRAAKNVKDAMRARLADTGYLVEIATRGGVEYADQEFNYDVTTDSREDAFRFDSELAARTWANSYKGNGTAKVVKDAVGVRDSVDHAEIRHSISSIEQCVKSSDWDHAISYSERLIRTLRECKDVKDSACGTQVHDDSFEQKITKVKAKMTPEQQRKFDKFYNEDYFDLLEGRIESDANFFNRFNKEFEWAVERGSVDGVFGAMRMLGRKIGVTY